MSSFSTCCVHATALHRLSDGLCKAQDCDCAGIAIEEATTKSRASGYPSDRMKLAAADIRIHAEMNGGYVELDPRGVRALADLLDSSAVGLEVRGVTARMKNAERAAASFADTYLADRASRYE